MSGDFINRELLILLHRKLYLTEESERPERQMKRGALYRLLQRLRFGFGAAEEAKILSAFITSEDEAAAKMILKRCEDEGVKIITWFDDIYPFHTIGNAPPVIYVRGSLDNPAIVPHVGIVGSRKATDYGRAVTRRIVTGLVQYNVTVVSGMAYGIDATAHSAAIESGLKTVAVLGCGIDINYPRSHRELSKRIAEAGAVVSEFPLGTPPLKHNFPIRNRLISGLSKGVVIVEAELESGSLITARWAAEQGREVFAVPGNIDRALSRGTNRLIRDGAHIFECVSDVAAVLKLQRGEITDDFEKNSRQEPPYDDIKCRIAEFLAGSGGSLEALAEVTGLSPSELLPLVTKAETIKNTGV